MAKNFQLIKRPVITERATQLKALGNQYVFAVDAEATKGDIRQAVEELFKVKVQAVNTMRVRGKFRRMGNAPGGHRAVWKKAIITVKAGQEIKYLEEGQA